MKRRNFLRTIAGLPIISIIPRLVKASSSRDTFHHYSPTLINHDNIKINGTFEEWVGSIAREIEKLLAVKSKEPDAYYFGHKYSVEVMPCDWNSKQDGSMPALRILIYITKHKLVNHLSFAKFEWDRHRKSPKALRSILNVRFMDCIWSMYYTVREQVIFLKKLDIDCCKSLNEYGAI